MATQASIGKQWVVRVKVAFTDPEMLLRSGMEIDVDARVTLMQNVLRLPKDSVLEVGGRTYVFVTNGGTVTRTEVTTGLAGLRDVEVISGLREGVLVAASGIDHLRRGHRVSAAIPRR